MTTSPKIAIREQPPFKPTRILVPTDFSACAEEALAFAARLARTYQAKIRLLHILTVLDTVQDTPDDTAIASELRRELQEDAHRQITESARMDAANDIHIEPVLRKSLAVAPSILGEAVVWEADLIVLGTHGRKGLNYLLMGSVAEEVVRRAPVSVLTVNHVEGKEPHIRRILAPTDLSDHAAQAVEGAKELARQYGAALDLLHVVEPIPFPASISMGAWAFTDYIPDLRKHLQDKLEDLASGDGFTTEMHIENGHAAKTITHFAEEHESDLIVMATHGLSGLARFFIGSTTERVVRTAPCPVLTIRTMAPPSEAFDKPAATEEMEVVP